MNGVPEGMLKVDIEDGLDVLGRDLGLDFLLRLGGNGLLFLSAAASALASPKYLSSFSPLAVMNSARYWSPRSVKEDIRPCRGYGMSIHGGTETGGVGGMGAGQGDDGRLLALVDIIRILVFLLIKEHIQQDKASRITGTDAEKDRLAGLLFTSRKFHPLSSSGYNGSITSDPGKEKILRGIFAVGIM